MAIVVKKTVKVNKKNKNVNIKFLSNYMMFLFKI